MNRPSVLLVAALSLGPVSGCTSLLSALLPHLPDAAVNDTPDGDVVGGGGVDGGHGHMNLETPFVPVADNAASAQQLAAWLESYSKGGAVDWNGDGVADVMITVAGDGSHEIHVPGPFGDRLTMRWRSVDDFTQTSDDDADGVADSTWTVSRAGGTRTSVRTSDRDLDGATDERITQTTNGAHTTSMVEHLLTPLDGGKRVMTITSAWQSDVPSALCAVNPPLSAPSPTGHPAAGTPGLCNGYCNYDCTLMSWAAMQPRTKALPGGKAFVVTTGTFGCDDKSYNRIAAAYANLPTAIERLANVNVDYANGLMTALAAKRIVYACGAPACIPNTTVAATVAAPFDGDDVTAVTSLIPGAENGLSLPDDAIAVSAVGEVIFHEMFHLFTHHTVDLGGQEERDFIYGCSRLMVNWKAGLDFYLGVKSDASSSRDGAICATIEHKPQFGAGQAYLPIDNLYYEKAPGTVARQVLCAVDSKSQPTAFATCGLEHYYLYCDQTPKLADLRPLQELDSFVCASVCPPGASFSDAPCMAPLAADAPLRRVDGCEPVPGMKY